MEKQIGTYGESYLAWLHHIIENGGGTAFIDKAVQEYNDMGRPDWHGSVPYYSWRQDAQHVCTRCGGTYQYGDKLDGAPGTVQTCLPCLQKKAPDGV